MNAHKGSTFAQDAAMILAAQAIAMVFGFLVRPLVARWLGPTEYGVFALILGTSAIIPAFILLTLNGGLMYYAAREKAASTVGKMSYSVAVAMAVLSLVMFLPGYWLISIFSPLGIKEYIAAFALAIGIGLTYIIQATLQGRQQFTAFSVFNASAALLMGVGTLVAGLVWPTSLITVAGRVGGLFLAIVLGMRFIQWASKFSMHLLVKVARYSAPLSVAALLGTLIAVVDKYVIAYFHAAQDVGQYDIASALAVSVLPFISALSTAMFPRVAKDKKRMAVYYEKVSSATLGLTGIASLAILYYSDILVYMLLGSSYVEQTSTILKIIALSVPLVAWTQINTTALNAIGKTAWTGVLSVAAVGLALAGSILLVPSWSGAGAAWAYAFSYLVIAIVATGYLAARHGVNAKPSLTHFVFFVFFAGLFWAGLGSAGFLAKSIGLLLFVGVTTWMERHNLKGVVNQAKAILAQNRV